MAALRYHGGASNGLDVLAREATKRAGGSNSGASPPDAGHFREPVASIAETNATSASAAAGPMRVDSPRALDGGATHTPSRTPAFRASVDPVTAALQHILLLFIAEGDPIEYRWGKQGRWYRCTVSSVMLGEADEGHIVELEFLPRKNARTKRVREFSSKLKVMQLLLDGDLAVPGVHLDWD